MFHKWYFNPHILVIIQKEENGWLWMERKESMRVFGGFALNHTQLQELKDDAQWDGQKLRSQKSLDAHINQSTLSPITRAPGIFCPLLSQLLLLLFSCWVMSNSLWFHGLWNGLYGLPGFSVHGVSQAIILEWVTIPSSRGIFPTQGLNLRLLHWQADFFYHWATREALYQN